MAFEMTPQERERWIEHNRNSKRLSDGLRGNPKLKRRSTDKKTIKKVLDLYQLYGVNYIGTTLNMSVDTVKNILRKEGVYE